MLYTYLLVRTSVFWKKCAFLVNKGVFRVVFRNFAASNGQRRKSKDSKQMKQ